MAIPNFSLEGKVAIVTGGKQGIGEAIALGFAEAGADVAVCGRVIDDGKLQAVAEKIKGLGRRSLAIQADISRKTDVDRLIQRVVDELGGIDILVNNAGILVYGPLLELHEEDWDKTIDTHMKGYYLCSQAAAKMMIKQKGGNIINMASGWGVKPTPIASAYCIAKAGVIMITRALALELADYNIRVNAIAPGAVRTELNQMWLNDPEITKQVESTIPLGHRVAEPGEIVGTALLLASDASSYITGDIILIDGGLYV